MITIISTSLIFLACAIIFLYILPQLIIISSILFTTIIMILIRLIIVFSPKKKRQIITDKIIESLPDDETIKKFGINCGIIINAMQRDWLPKLVRGERIAELLIRQSRKMEKTKAMLDGFIDGLQGKNNYEDKQNNHDQNQNRDC